MQLEDLKIWRRWTNNELSGSIKFKNNDAEIQLKLTDEAARKILAICADSLVQVSKEAAENLTANIIEAKNLALEENNTTGAKGGL